MGVTFTCGNCGKPFDVGYEVAGKTGRCKRCGAIFTIPLASTSIPVPPRAAPTAPISRTRPARSAPIPRSRSYASDVMPPPRPRDHDDLGSIPPPRADNPDTILPPVAAPLPVQPKKTKPSGWRRSKAKPPGKKKSLMQWVVSFGTFFLLIKSVLSVLQFTHVLPNGVRRMAPGGGAQGIQQIVAKYAAAPIALPRFPDVGPGQLIEPGVMFHEIILGPLNRPIGGPPGLGGKLWLYLPSASDGADRSLPGILITGAGSRLINGMALTDGDRAEHLPYVREGFAVLAFELDGSVPESAPDSAYEEAMIRFLTARAGLVNAHVALEYALAKVPAIDPSRISIAGHSSAGVVAVLFAETDPRLKSAVAYAPAVDLEKRFGPSGVAMLQQSGFGDLAVRYSPMNKVSTLGCPLFLFQARDDTNTPAAEAEAFVRQATATGKSVTLDMVETGGHYQAMVEQGIPHAIAWLKGESLPSEAEVARRPNPRVSPTRIAPGPVGAAPPPGNRPDRARERFEAIQKRRDEIRQRLGRGPR